jgi:hypothetical protein
MNSSSTLSGSHLRTYDRLFQHPVSHNLEWRDVRSLFGHLGHMTEEANGNLKVTRNGQTLVLHAPQTKDVASTEELMQLRHFLERSETVAVDATAAEAHWLVVIDHREARIFRTEMRGSVPQQIRPYEPDGYFRHQHNSKDFSRGQEKPDPNSFFEPVARALHDARQILIFGSGTGAGSEMTQFITWLGQHHADLAGRIIGSLVVDESHLTECQLLAKAREFYAQPRVPEKMPT